jgi:hypothetical protein
MHLDTLESQIRSHRHFFPFYLCSYAHIHTCLQKINIHCDLIKLTNAQPQRAITYIKAAYPLAKFEATFNLLWQWLWYEHHDISKPDVFSKLLQSPEAGFSAEQVEEIMAAANDKKWKDALLAKTQEALDQGAFGAPWFWVIKKGEKGEVLDECGFFGSDRLVFFSTRHERLLTVFSDWQIPLYVALPGAPIRRYQDPTGEYYGQGKALDIIIVMKGSSFVNNAEFIIQVIITFY